MSNQEQHRRELPPTVEADVATAVHVLKTTMSERLRHLERAYGEMEAHIQEVWGEALDLFDLAVAEATAIGARFIEQYQDQARVSDDSVFSVLMAVHARACRTAHAIGRLMRAGYAMDALARWRTVHELAVVAHLVHKHGRPLAERYRMHETIADAKWAEVYNEHAATLGWEPLDEQYVATLRLQRDELLRRFGKAFRTDYGWAAAIRPDNPAFEPKLTDLEKEAGLEYARPYYALSSHDIHPGVKGLVLNEYDAGEETTMLVGPSVLRLGAPGHATLISLVHCTTMLLASRRDGEGLLPAAVLRRVADEAIAAFHATETRQAEEPLDGHQLW